jgi:hypothetical protein
MGSGGHWGVETADKKQTIAIMSQNNPCYNARLIATAPELLKELEDIVNLIPDDYGVREIPAGYLDAARAAIRKAKGEV